MEKAFFHLIFFISLLASCTGIKQQKNFQKIESYIQERPDCALKELSTINTEQLGRASLQARHSLLYSMALDKNYIDIVNDSIIRIAVDYYSSRKKNHYTMLSWYYLGRVQFNGGSLGDAAISFTKAERLAKDPHWKGLIYRNLGDLYGQSLDLGTAASYYSLSEKYFQEANEERYAIYSSFNLARSLYSTGETELADSIWTILRKYAVKKDAYLYSQLLLAEASLALSSQNPDPNDVLFRLHTGHGIAKEPLRCIDMGNLSLAHALKNQRDSADYFFSTALTLAHSIMDTAKLYAIRYRMEDYYGDYALANDYLEKAMALQNTLMNKRENLVISSYLEQNARQERAATQQLARQRILTLIAIVFFLVFAVFLLFARIKQHRSIIREQTIRIEEDMIQTGEILDQLERTKDENNEIHRQIRTAILDQISMIKQWSDAYYGIKSPAKSFKNNPGRIFDEDYIPDSEMKTVLIKNFCDSLTILRSNNTLFHNLEESVNRWKDGIMIRVRENCHESGKKKQSMDESDFRTLALMFAEVPDKTIAYLMNLSYGAVRMRRYRYKVFFEQLETEMADLLVKELSR